MQVENSPAMAGLSDESKPSVTVDKISQPWMTQSLVEYTRRVWSPRYGHDLTDMEVIEILNNTKRLAETMVRIHQENALTR